MLRKTICCVLLAVIAGSAVLPAQDFKPAASLDKKASEMGLKTRGFLDHLLDPSKFTMSHSYSISVFSLGKQSFSQGLYMNTMNYKFSDPLTMQVRVGYLHQPFGGVLNKGGMQNGINGTLFLQRAMIQYKPTKNMSITVDYQAYPSSMVSPFHYRYRRW